MAPKCSTRSYSLTSRSVHLPMLLPSGPVMAGGGVFGDLGPLLTLLKTVLSFCEWVAGLRGEAKKRRRKARLEKLLTKGVGLTSLHFPLPQVKLSASRTKEEKLTFGSTPLLLEEALLFLGLDLVLGLGLPFFGGFPSPSTTLRINPTSMESRAPESTSIGLVEAV